MGTGDDLHLLTKPRWMIPASLVGVSFIAEILKLLSRPGSVLHEDDQEQSSGNWKARDFFFFFFYSCKLLLPIFSSQLSPAVSGKNEKKAVTVISPLSQREMSDSPQHHGLSERGFLSLSLFF